jgi:hypothetical protein
MAENKWVVLEVIPGSFQAEILRGLLEAQGIPVVLSQEGAGHYAYATTVGSLGAVQLLVPADELENAEKVLADYRAGVFEASEPFENPDLVESGEEGDEEEPEDDED